MYPLLLKYLVLHKSLPIPKIGVFTITHLRAEIDSAHHLLIPPMQTILFKEEAVNVTDDFYEYLVTETGLDLVAITTELQKVTDQILLEITTQTGAIINGIGTLIKHENGLMSFTQENTLDYLFKPISINQSIVFDSGLNTTVTNLPTGEIQPVNIGKSNETFEASDNWWIYALALLFIGIGALLFYYI